MDKVDNIESGKMKELCNENKSEKYKIKPSKSIKTNEKILNSQYELNIRIGMLNVQGLTKEKAIEITNLLNSKENDITMLVRSD